MQSLFFGEVKVGMKFRSALCEPFTLEMLEAHARLTGDRVHKPVTVLGQERTVVQGNLVTARTGGLLFELGHFNDTLLFQAEKRIKFRRPVFIGDRIYATEEVVEVEDQEGKPYGKVILVRLTLNAEDVIVQEVWQDYRVRK